MVHGLPTSDFASSRYCGVPPIPRLHLHKRSVLALLAFSFHLEPTLHPASLYIFVPTYIIKLKPAGSIELQCTSYVFPW